MHADRVGIQAIRAGAKNQIVSQPAETLIPIAPKAVGRQPPQEVEKMRARKLGDATPGEF